MLQSANSNNPNLPQISQKTGEALSQLQQQFNQKIQHIDNLKGQLAERTRAVEEIKARVQQEIRPLVQDMVQQRIAYVQVLDEAYQQGFLRKNEQKKLGYLLDDLTYSLIVNYGVEELKEMHDRYAELSFDEEAKLAEAEAKEQTQDLLKSVLGLEVDLQDLTDLESLQDRLDEQMRREQEKRDAQRAQRQKTRIQEAKEAKAKAELQSISKTTRRLYTDLAKLLHPDTEQDPAARIWKEEAMKQVTTAYHQDDFFELLRLQLEFLQGPDLHLLKLPQEQLKFYVKLLTEQVQELQNELDSFFFEPESRLLNEFGGAPKQQETKFRRAKQDLRDEIQHLTHMTKTLKEPQALREFLKQIR